MSALSQRINEELAAIQNANPARILDAKEVVEWAKAHPDSALHGQFTWNDEKAAYEHRLFEARRIIAIHFVNEEGERKVYSVSLDRVNGGGYRNIDEIIDNEALRNALLSEALGKLKHIKRQYQHLKELASVYEEIERADSKHTTETRVSA